MPRPGLNGTVCFFVCSVTLLIVHHETNRLEIKLCWGQRMLVYRGDKRAGGDKGCCDHLLRFALLFRQKRCLIVRPGLVILVMNSSLPICRNRHSLLAMSSNCTCTGEPLSLSLPMRIKSRTLTVGADSGCLSGVKQRINTNCCYAPVCSIIHPQDSSKGIQAS